HAGADSIAAPGSRNSSHGFRPTQGVRAPKHGRFGPPRLAKQGLGIQRRARGRAGELGSFPSMRADHDFRRADDPLAIPRLRAVLDDDELILAGPDLDYYGADRCKGGWPVAPGAIALPRRVEQVQAIARVCSELRVAIVPSGGRTGLTGAATAIAGELVVSLERMTAILDVDPTSRLLRCQAGATVQAVQDAAAAAGLSYPVDFAAKGSAQ